MLAITAGGWYQPDVAQFTCINCRAECLPAGSPSIKYWDYPGEKQLCGVTNIALPGASASNDFEYTDGMSAVGMYKDAPGALDLSDLLRSGPFTGPGTGATVCGRCEAGFVLEFLDKYGEAALVGASDPLQELRLCVYAPMNGTEEESLSACMNVGEDSCLYTASRARKEEDCFATDLDACRFVNVSGVAPITAAINCQTAGACFYTTTTDVNGTAVSTCSAMHELGCATAAPGHRACMAGGACRYISPVAPVNRSCVANNNSLAYLKRVLERSQNSSGFKCTACDNGQYSVPNGAECAFSCPPASYTQTEVVKQTGDPAQNQYPLGLTFYDVGACVPCGHVDADTNEFTDILDDDEEVIGQLEKAKFYKTEDHLEEQLVGVFEECCASPTENGFAQTARGCIECPIMDRCVSGQCVMNSADEACSMCRFGFFSVGARCVECPKDAMTESLTYMIVIAGAGGLLSVLWKVTRVKGDDTDGDSNQNQQQVEDAQGNKDTVEDLQGAQEDSGRALSNTAIYAGIALPQLQVSFMTFQLPIGFPLELAQFSRYFSGIVSFDIGQLASPECSVDQTQGVVYMLFFRFITTHVTFVAFCAVLVFLCRHGEQHKRHTTNCLLAIYTLCIGTLIKSCVNTVKCTNRGEKLDIYTLDIAPSVICYKGPNANEYLEVDPLFYTMAASGVAGLLVYGLLIPAYVWARLKIGCKAAEQVARGVKGHLMSLQEVTVRSDRRTDSQIVGILPADTIVQVFEKVLSPSGKIRARIGENEWVTEKTHIKRLMCDEAGIHVKNAAFQETYGWLILKYKPDRWWFELPLLFYKVATIVATELLAGSNDSTRALFLILITGAIIILVLVIVDKPFKDGATTHGMSGADKAEVISFLAMLAGFAVGVWCWQKTSGCKLLKFECTYDDAIELTPMESIFSTFGMIITSLIPTAYMVYEIKSQRKQRRKDEEEKLTKGKLALYTAELAELEAELKAAKPAEAKRISELKAAMVLINAKITAVEAGVDPDAEAKKAEDNAIAELKAANTKKIARMEKEVRTAKQDWENRINASQDVMITKQGQLEKAKAAFEDAENPKGKEALEAEGLKVKEMESDMKSRTAELDGVKRQRDAAVKTMYAELETARQESETALNQKKTEVNAAREKEKQLGATALATQEAAAAAAVLDALKVPAKLVMPGGLTHMQKVKWKLDNAEALDLAEGKFSNPLAADDDEETGTANSTIGKLNPHRQTAAEAAAEKAAAEYDREEARKAAAESKSQKKARAKRKKAEQKAADKKAKEDAKKAAKEGVDVFEGDDMQKFGNPLLGDEVDESAGQVRPPSPAIDTTPFESGNAEDKPAILVLDSSFDSEEVGSVNPTEKEELAVDLPKQQLADPDEEIRQQWIASKDVEVCHNLKGVLKGKGGGKKWDLKTNNVVHIDDEELDKDDNIVAVLISIVVGHPQNAMVSSRSKPGWIRMADESGDPILLAVLAKDAWGAVEVLISASGELVDTAAEGDAEETKGEQVSTGVKRIGRTDSFEDMLREETRIVHEEEAIVQEQHRLLREKIALEEAREAEKHPKRHHKHKADKEELAIIEKELQLEEKEVMLAELAALKTTAHAAEDWGGGEHLTYITNENPDGTPAGLQQVGVRAPTPVLPDTKHIYKIKQVAKGVPAHKSHYKLKPVHKQMIIDDAILHDWKRDQLIGRRQKAEEAYLAAQTQYDLVKAQNPKNRFHRDTVVAWEKMAMVEAHLERMNRLGDGIPRPQDEIHTVNLDMYLREVEVYDALVAPPEEDVSLEVYMRREWERQNYKKFHIGAKVVTTKTPKLGVVTRQETRGNDCGVHVNFKDMSVDGKGKEDKWIPLEDKASGDSHSLGCLRLCVRSAAIEPVAERLAVLKRGKDLTRFDE